MYVCVDTPVELQQLLQWAEDDVEVREAQDGSVRGKSCGQGFLVNL